MLLPSGLTSPPPPSPDPGSHPTLPTRTSPRLCSDPASAEDRERPFTLPEQSSTSEPHNAFDALIPNTQPRKYHGDSPSPKMPISSGWNGSLQKQCEALTGDRVPGVARMTPFLLLAELGGEAVAEPAKDKLTRHLELPGRAGGEREFRVMLSLLVEAGSQAHLEKELWGLESRARVRDPVE